MAAADYKEYLAAQILSENTVVSYRNLSRALKVHSNAAKQMLYAFHKGENERKPGSVHASYLVSGTPKRITLSPTNGVNGHDEDSAMANSSFMDGIVDGAQEEQPEQLAITRVIVVGEENLDAAKSAFDSITSLHVYSLELGAINNLEVLSDCNRKVAINFSQEDPLETWKQYGTIHNPLAKRRAGQRPATAQPPPAAAAQITSKATAKPTAQPQTKSSDSRPTSRDGSVSDAKAAVDSSATKKTTAKPSTLKRDNSDIFKAFSKAKTKPKEEQASSGAASPAPSKTGSAAEDELMRDAFGDEDEGDDTNIPELKEDPEKAEASRKAKEERAEKLRQMAELEDSDQDESAHDSPASAASPDHEVIDTNAVAVKEPEVQPDQVVVQGGRRRGRRWVIKKKTTRDAEDYLVTKEEGGWEYFSEEEPAPKKPKPSVSIPTPPAANAKKANKPGQGSIMSFFGKK